MGVPPKPDDPTTRSARITASGLPIVEGDLTPGAVLTRFRAADYETPAPAPLPGVPRQRRIAAARLILVRTAPKR